MMQSGKFEKRVLGEFAASDSTTADEAAQEDEDEGTYGTGVIASMNATVVGESLSDGKIIDKLGIISDSDELLERFRGDFGSE